LLHADSLAAKIGRQQRTCQCHNEVDVGFYSRVIFPRLCDWLLNQPPVAEQRNRLLSEAAGEILEIGFGTGLNLPHYPRAVTKITAIDPNPGMHRQAQPRIKASGISVAQHVIGGERLPFPDSTFDCVVSTFTLCSVEDVNDAVGEAFRVLKPGGPFLFLEHGLAPEPAVQRWQRRWNWLQQRLAAGCRLDRPMKSLIASVPFVAVHCDEFYLEKTPKTHGYLYRGVATR
jgi:SAM-dependent methyltransferase